MSFKNKIKVVYRMYGKYLMKIILIGAIIISISCTLLSDPASAYSLWDISAHFGDVSHIHPNGHTGVDFVILENTPLKSIVDGVVEQTRDTGEMGYGKSVQIRTPDGRLVIYGHLNEFNVKVGDIIKVGDIVAESGNTGRSTGAHLHLQINDKHGNPINPMSTIMDGRVNKLMDVNVVRK